VRPAVALLVVWVAACDDGPAGSGVASTSGGSGGAPATTASAGGATSAGDLCATCGAPETTGAIVLAAIDEVSGVAASRVHDGVLYVHDDSGESARFFAIDRAGASRGTFTLEGVTAIDWEDVAAAPCADGTPGCLVFADTGDNAAARAEVAILRVREPAEVGDGVEATLAAESFSFSYPDGPHDVEAVAVHPATGVVTLVSKDVPSVVFELRPPLADGMSAVRIGEVTLPSAVPLATGADVDPSAARLAIRTYSDVLLFPIPATGTAADALVLGAACSAPIAAELQGEAVAFLADGSGLVTIPEGAGAEVHHLPCD
jgi:hypothetical protein